jgi:hypothetical protein
MRRWELPSLSWVVASAETSTQRTKHGEQAKYLPPARRFWWLILLCHRPGSQLSGSDRRLGDNLSHGHRAKKGF